MTTTQISFSPEIKQKNPSISASLNSQNLDAARDKYDTPGPWVHANNSEIVTIG